MAEKKCERDERKQKEEEETFSYYLSHQGSRVGTCFVLRPHFRKKVVPAHGRQERGVSNIPHSASVSDVLPSVTTTVFLSLTRHFNVAPAT